MKRYFFVIILGALLASTFFYEFFLIVPVVLAITIVYIIKNTNYYKNPEFLLGIFVFSLTHSHWYLSLHHFLSIKEAIFLWLGISFYLFLIWFIFFYLLKFLLRNPSGYFLIPVFWTFYEWLMSIGTFGYPFMSIYLTQSNSLFRWLSFSIINSYSISFFVLTISTIIALIITKKIKNNINRIFFSFFFLFLLIGAGDSFLSKNVHKNKTIKTTIIQPNINQQNKQNEELFEEHLNKYLSLINKAIKEYPETEILFLPETIIPAFWEEKIRQRILLSTHIANRIAIFGQPVQRNSRIYNSILFYKEGKYIVEYYKRHLVPFGEYWPIIFNWISLYNTIFYFPGNNINSPINIKGLEIAPLICFESAFSRLINFKFDLGVILTNDAWFNEMFKKLHLRTVRFRASETRKPFIYATNNGISAVIDSHGKISTYIPDLKTGYAFSEVIIPSEKKSYILSIFYYFPLWVLIFLIILIIDNKKNNKISCL
jgi:apolipoprotein N-acyltransferase